MVKCYLLNQNVLFAVFFYVFEVFSFPIKLTMDWQRTRQGGDRSTREA